VKPEPRNLVVLDEVMTPDDAGHSAGNLVAAWGTRYRDPDVGNAGDLPRRSIRRLVHQWPAIQGIGRSIEE
jgi:hypothetical protein